jgi:hypothetical protein
VKMLHYLIERVSQKLKKYLNLVIPELY